MMSREAGISRWIESRPAQALVMGAVAIILLTLLAAIEVKSWPSSTIDVRLAAAGTYRVAGAGEYPDDAVQLLDSDGAPRLTLPLGVLEQAREPHGSASDVARIIAQRNAIAAFHREEGMQLRLPDGRVLPARALDKGWSGMPLQVWLILFSGMCSALAGLWVYVLRPREEPARAFAAAALSYLGVTYTVAWLVLDNPAMSGTFLMRIEAANYLGCFAIGMGLVWLFARYPVRIAPAWVLMALAATLFGLWLWGFAQPWDHLISAMTGILLLQAIVICGLLLTQAWLTRGDPVMRAVFLWIGSTLLLSIALVVAGNILPVLFGMRTILPMASFNLLFMLFFFALGFAVTRYRLFELGQWSTAILRVSGIVLMIVLVDAALALMVGRTWLLSVSLLLALFIWLPIRDFVLRRGERRQRANALQLVRDANRIAFGQSRASQKASWRNLLQDQFEPLEIVSAPVDRIAIGDDGRELSVPSPLEDGGHRIAYAAGGRRLFTRQDVALARAMHEFVSEIVDARRDYDKGAAAERQRIARDLHDDVGARLMTGLHRPELVTMRSDIRQALSDMRLIIDGLSGQARYLGDALADLRHETVTRLSLAGIGVQWPLGQLADNGDEDEIQIGHAISRTLNSVTRELVTNIIRHSEARQVTIDCQMSDGWLALSIADDGKGFQRPPELAAGNGLGNARKRAAESGGTLDIMQSGKGTVIALRIPLPSRDQGMAAIARQQ